MSTYLYCVLTPPKADALPRGLSGIAGAPVRSLRGADLGEMEAWVATIEDASLRVTGRELATQALMHNEVVNAALATGRTPAPARYGSRFTDDAACVADLARRATELHAMLNHIAGAVEISALLTPSETRHISVVKPRASEAAAGRRYLESLRSRAQEQERRRAAAETEAARVSSAVGKFIRGEARSFTSSGVLSISHLVPTPEIARYREALAALRLGGTFRLIVSEVRAPYSFTSPKADTTGHDSGTPKRDE